MKSKLNVLPETVVFTNSDDIKFILFQQSEVISDFIRGNDYWFPQILKYCDSILSRMNEDLGLDDNSPAGVVVDIGSGFGSISIPLAIVHNKNTKFVCFEPVGFLTKQLTTNLLLNCINNVTIHNVGISNENVSVEAPSLDPFLCGNHGSFSFAREYDEIRNIHSKETDTFELRTLDSYKLSNVKLIKISCNGYELNVLSGAKETVKQNNFPPIVLEVWNDGFYFEQKQQIKQLLNELGYKHITTTDTHLIAVESDDLAELILNAKSNAKNDLIDDNDNELPVIEEENTTKIIQQSDGMFDIVEVSYDTEATMSNQTIYKQQ